MYVPSYIFFPLLRNIEHNFHRFCCCPFVKGLLHQGEGGKKHVCIGFKSACAFSVFGQIKREKERENKFLSSSFPPSPSPSQEECCMLLLHFETGYDKFHLNQNLLLAAAARKTS